MTEGSSVEVLSGAGVLDELGEPLDDLHAATATPVTARRPWLAVWARTYTGWEPWAVAVRDRTTGRLEAAALLCRRSEHGVNVVGTLGHGRNDRSRLPARCPAVADRLADAVADALRSLDGPWTLRLEQLPADDRVAAALLARVPSTQRLRAAPVPKVEFADDDGDIDSYLGKGMRKQLRRCRQRVEGEGYELDIAFEGDPAGIRGVIGEVEEAHRDRDHQVGRASDIDSEEGLRFWREVVLQHADRGQVEIATLRLAGRLAAYVISFLDGPSYRVLDGRFSPDWARFSPGRIVETATLRRALEDPRYTHLDWMNSVASEKLVAANAFESTIHVVGCSPELLREPVPPHGVVILDEAVEGRPTAEMALMALARIEPEPR